MEFEEIMAVKKDWKKSNKSSRTCGNSNSPVRTREDNGLPAFSLRNLAASLEVQVSSLYNHIQGQNDLLTFYWLNERSKSGCGSNPGNAPICNANGDCQKDWYACLCYCRQYCNGRRLWKTFRRKGVWILILLNVMIIVYNIFQCYVFQTST